MLGDWCVAALISLIEKISGIFINLLLWQRVKEYSSILQWLIINILSIYIYLSKIMSYMTYLLWYNIVRIHDDYQLHCPEPTFIAQCFYLLYVSFFFSFKSLRIFLSLYARIKFLKPLGVMIIHCTHQVYCGITNQQSFTWNFTRIPANYKEMWASLVSNFPNSTALVVFFLSPFLHVWVSLANCDKRG